MYLKAFLNLVFISWDINKHPNSKTHELISTYDLKELNYYLLTTNDIEYKMTVVPHNQVTENTALFQGIKYLYYNKNGKV